MDLVQFEDKSQSETRPYVPTAVFYGPEGAPQCFGFEALYAAPEGTPNLKTGFKADLIDPREKLQSAYGVEATKGVVILTPQKVLEDFVRFVLQTSLSQIESKVKGRVKRVGVVIGVPVIEDKARRESYREILKGAVKKALDEIGKDQLADKNELLLYEPLAVYRYYREMKSIPSLGKELNVLVVDWGGGTMNLAVIKTTKKGDIITKAGSAAHIPKSIEGIKAGGTHLDRKLVELLLSSEDDAFRSKVESCHRDMLDIERAKIELTNKICFGKEANPFKKIELRGKTFRMTKDHLRQAFDAYWTNNIRHKVNVILKQSGLESPDLVLLAGGSSRIPFIRDKMCQLLNLNNEEQIKVGENFEQAVGCGLAYQANDFLGTDSDQGEKLALLTVDDVYLLAGGKTFTVFEKDQAVDESTGLLQRKFEVPLSASSKRFVAIYAEGAPEDRMEYVLNPTKRRFELNSASDVVEVQVRADDRGYVEAEYFSGGQRVGENDFYIGIGQLSQWSVDVVIGVDIGTTNTAVGYFVGP